MVSDCINLGYCYSTDMLKMCNIKYLNALQLRMYMHDLYN